MGFCLTTYTVGSLPCMTAAALAKTDRPPVVFISGAPGEDELGASSIHHMVQPTQAWRAGYNAALVAFAALGIRSERLQGDRTIGQPNIAAYRFFEWVKHAWLHREPVLVEVPRNLVFALTQALKLPPLQRIQDSDIVFDGLAHIVSAINDRLLHSKAPFVHVGEQVCRNPVLTTKVRQFCHQNPIPFVTI